MLDISLQDKNILIVDAAPLRLDFLTAILHNTCQVRAALDYKQMIQCIRVLLPDLILIIRPRGPMDGLAVLERLKADCDYSFLPVLFVLTAEDSRLEAAALARDALACITWPLTPHLLRLRVRHLLARQDEMTCLSRRLAQAEKAARATRRTLIGIYLQLLRAEDPELAAHARRVGCLSQCLARRVSFWIERALNPADIPLIADAACLHDLGKLLLPPGLRRERGDMSGEQKKQYRKHPLLAEQLLQPAARELGENRFLHLAAELAACHHERYDGRGWPHGLKGQELSFAAQVVAVANRFDHARMPPPLGSGLDSDRALVQALGGESKDSLFAPVIDHAARECSFDLSVI